MDTHNKHETYECEICDRKFKTKRARAHHRLIDHMTEEEKAEQAISCDICGKEMMKRQLAQHLRNAHSDKDYKCDYCDKTYSQGYLLQLISAKYKSCH